MNPLIWYAGLYSASAAVLKLAGFLLFVWLARTLSVDDYAAFGLLYALQTGLATFALAGIIEAIVGALKSHRLPQEQPKLFAAANAAFVFTALSVSALGLVVFFSVPKHSQTGLPALAAVVTSAALLAYSSLQAQIVRLEERHAWSLCFSFLSPFAGLIGAFVAFLFERSVQSFFVGSALGLSISLLGFWVKSIGFYGIVGRPGEIRGLLARGAPFIAVAFLGWISGYGNNYVVNFLFESQEVARFTFALALSSIMPLLASALNQVWSPRFYRITHELPLDLVERKNRRFYRLQSVVLGAAAGIVMALFSPALNMLGGNLVTYGSMNLELALLMSSYVMLSPWWHCHNYFLAYDKGPSVMRVVVTTSIIGTIVWLLLMWLLGPIGIYIGFFVQMLTRSIGISIAAKSYWPIRVSWDGVAVGVALTLIGFAASKA